MKCRKQRDKRLGNACILCQGGDHSRHAVIGTCLSQVAIPGTQPNYRLWIKSGNCHQLIEHVIFCVGVEHLTERTLEHQRARHDRWHFAAAQRQPKIVDVIAIAERRRRFFKNVETKIFQGRHDIAQWHRAAVAIYFQPQYIAVRDKSRYPAMVAFHIQQPDHVARSFVGRVHTAIIGWKGRAIPNQHRGRALFIGHPSKRCLNCRLPSTHHQFDPVVQCTFIDLLRTVRQIERVTQQRNTAVFKSYRPAEHIATGRCYQHILDLLTHTSRDIVTR